MSSEVISGEWKVTVPRRFEVKEELGRGGMAVVFRAYDKAGERDVALKFLPATEDEQLKKRFQREAVDLSGMFHPNVVDFYSLGESDGHEFIEMEYVAGGTLGGFLRRCDSLKQVLYVFAEIFDGLHHIHECGLVHRDMKPANVLMTPDEKPKISDLGLAFQAQGRSQLTQDGTLLGTASYLAPEQLRSRVVGPQADLYSTGVALFEAVTCRRPFQATAPLALLRCHLEETPPTPSDILPGLPESLDRLVLGLMEKKPENRPSSARAVADELRRIAEQLEPHQDSLVATSPEALLARVKLHIEASDLQSAQRVLNELDPGSDLKLRLAVTVERARIAMIGRDPNAVELARQTVKSCREFDEIKLLGSALLVLGQATTQEGQWEAALEALQEARALIPSNNQTLQIELLESLAELHERGSGVGHPGLVADKAKQFRSIAAGLSRRTGSSSSPDQPAPEEPISPKHAPKLPADPGEKRSGSLAKAVLVGLIVLLSMGVYGVHTFLNRPGSIQVESDPPGATVTVNGERFTAPHTAELNPGNHTVKIFLQGYFPKEESVELKPGETFKLTATLKPSSGDLNLLSKPEGAKVFVNGQFRGKTPVKLAGVPIKKFDVKFVKDGYKDLEQKVEVFGGKTRNLEFALIKEPPPPPVYKPTYSNSHSGNQSNGGYSQQGQSSAVRQPASQSRRSSGQSRTVSFPKPSVRINIPKPKIKVRF